MDSNCSNDSTASTCSGSAGNGCTFPSINDVIHPAVDAVQALLVMTIIVLSLLSNSFVTFLVIRYRSLRRRPYLLALQIIILHLVFTSTVLPAMFVSAVLRRWELGPVMCFILGAIHDLLIIMRYLLSFVLALDRTLTIFFPFHYQKYATKVMIAMSCVAYIISVIRVATSYQCTTYIPVFKTCAAASCSNACQAHVIFFGSFAIFFGVIMSFGLYMLLFWKGRQLRTRLDICKSMEQAELRWKENKRTITTFVILVCVLVGCGFPPYVFYVLQSTLDLQSPSQVLLIFSILVGRTCLYSLNFADALVIIKNRDFKETIRHLLKRSNVRRSCAITAVSSS